MKQAFKDKTRESFWSLSVDFGEALQKVFPDCPETNDMVLFTKNIVRGNESLEIENINNWFDSMRQPLNKKVKYAKAVERLIGQPGNLYHACAYKDAAAIRLSATSQRLQRLNIEEKLSSHNFKEEDKEAFWKYLQEMNRLAFEYADAQVPEVPTREAIQKNIMQRSAFDSGANTNTSKGFVTALSTFNAARNMKSLYNYDNDEEMQKIYQTWSSLSKKKFGNKTLEQACNDRDACVLERLGNEFPELEINSTELDEQHWGLLSKIVSFCTISDAIPNKMMNTIENMASSLASEIASGKRDLNSLNLDDIGKQVLSQVNPEDVQHFANNVDRIIPAIASMQK
jgi:hypothetical protein